MLNWLRDTLSTVAIHSLKDPEEIPVSVNYFPHR